MPRQIEKLEKVDVLRPEIVSAVELDVLALVLPGRDRREAGRLPLPPRPQIEVDRRPGRAPRNAAQRDPTSIGAEIGAIGEKMRMRVEIGAGCRVGLGVFDLLVDRVGIDHDAHRAA